MQTLNTLITRKLRKRLLSIMTLYSSVPSSKTWLQKKRIHKQQITCTEQIRQHPQKCWTGSAVRKVWDWIHPTD